LTWANEASSLSASLRHARLAVDRDHQRPPLLDHPAGDREILLLGHVGGVEHDDHHVGEPDGVERVGNRGSLELLLDAAAPAHAGGIDQPHRPAAPLPVDTNGVARDARLRPREDPLLADQAVQQGRLADIRPADNRQQQRTFGRVLVLPWTFRRLGAFVLVLRRGGDVADQGIMQVAQPLAVLGRERHWRAETEAMCLGQALLAGAAFALVGDHDDLGSPATQPRCEALVERHDAGAGVDQEKHDIGAVDGALGEAAHARLERLATLGLPPRRIEQGEGEITELCRRFADVPRHAGRVVDDGAAAPDQPVEQRGLADIGPTDDGNPRRRARRPRRRGAVLTGGQ